MWKPQVTPLAEMRPTPDGPVITRTSLTSNKQEYRTVTNRYNSKPAPFQQVGNKKMVSPAYNSPMGVYSDDAIAETLSAQAEVLGQGVIGVNFMKNEKTYEGHKSDVLKMVQEMDSTPRVPSPGIVMCPSPSPNLHESPVQGQSFKLLERALIGEPSHSPAPAGPTSILKPGENICYLCGSLIVGVFVRIKNKNLHEHCFKCATCGMSLKNKGYYHVNDKPYCDIHAVSAARQNPPGPNLEPIAVGPGSPLPSGGLTTSQALSSASKFSPQSPLSPKMQPPSSSSLYRPPVGGVKIMPSIPTPAPYKPGPELLLKQCEPPAPMPTTEQDIPYIPVSNTEIMDQMLPKLPEHSVEQIKSCVETKSSQVMESALKITTETNKITEESMSAGAHVSISGGGETKINTQYNLEAAKEKDVSLRNNVDEREIIATTQITDENKYNEKNDETKESFDDHKIQNGSLQPHSTEAVIQPEIIPQVESKVSTVFDKMQELNSVVEVGKTESNLHKQTTSQNTQTEMNVSMNKMAQSQQSVSINKEISKGEIASMANKVVGLPDLNAMQLGGSQKSSTFEFAKQESKMSSSATQYTSSSSCYQSFGVEQKSKSSSSGVKVAGNIETPASSVFSAPSPLSPAAVTPTKHVTAPFSRPTGTANQQIFGTSSSDINVRAHIPKKGPAPPASFLPEMPQPSSMMPPSPLFDLPKPSMPPGAGPQRGIAIMPGQRSAPKRGRGIINPASVSRVPMCATCQRQIRGPFVSALGKTWCPDCFICATSNCRRPLINLGFVEEKGGLHCEDCYERYLAPACGKCDKKIKGDCLNAISKHFHPECFCCAYCGRIFGSGAFYLEDGLPYCEADWNDLFTTKCVGCKFPIEAGDRWVEALNNNYHSQCFKCSVCKSNLEGKSFYAKNGRPFCKAHASR